MAVLLSPTEIPFQLECVRLVFFTSAHLSSNMLSDGVEDVSILKAGMIQPRLEKFPIYDMACPPESWDGLIVETDDFTGELLNPIVESGLDLIP